MALEFETNVIYECRGEAAARVYVVAAPTTEIDRETLAPFRISGYVVGPTCVYSSTLQARIPLTHRGVTTWGGRTVITAEAVVPDPCYWSMELPFLYRAVGEISGAEQVGRSLDEIFGMRAVDVVRNKLALNGKIWVPRCVRRSVVVGDAPLSLWRDTDTTMSVDEPDDALLAEASRTGVGVVVRLGSAGNGSKSSLRSIAKYPAALVVALPNTAEADPTEFRNLIFAQQFDLEPGLRMVAPWARAFVLECSGERNPYNIATSATIDPRPWIPQRNTGKRTLLEARKACDELQADLAEICDPAGYIV